jgi:hypothetical protein
MNKKVLEVQKPFSKGFWPPEALNQQEETQ